MVREGDQGVVPLLQERFRQLQRMKELRQEQELQRMLSEYERWYSTTQEVKYPKPDECQLSLSLWPDSPPIFKREVDSISSPSNLLKSLFADAPFVSTLPIALHQNSATSHIDTSLRL